MLNLLRMNLYHLIRSKALYVCFILQLIIPVIAFGVLYALANPDVTDSLMKIGFTVSGNTDETTAALTQLTVLDVFSQASIAGGGFSTISGILAAIFICIDFSSGFIKNIISSHENKWDYILSKLCCLGFVNFLYLTGACIITWVLNTITGGFFTSSSPKDIIFYIFTAWMIQNGFSALILFICMISRNLGASITAVILLCGGVIVSLLNALLGLFGLEWITGHTLYLSLAEFPTSFKEGYDFRVCLTGFLFFVLYTILAKFVLTKKDI